jgi:O-antigen/teichoic acid export membrane protein
MTAFGFFAVEAGQPGALPALVARERGRAGEFLGTALSWRAVSLVAVYGALAAASLALGYEWEFHVALALVVLTTSISSFTGGSLDVVLGFERTDIRAYAQIGQQFLIALFVIPTLVLGGRLHATLLAQAVALLVVAFFVFRSLRVVGVQELSFRRAALKMLFSQGTPFLLLGLVSSLQPNIDALLLSKLAAPESMGWHAAARKVVGLLIFPINAMVNALYPTLCRLYAESADAFRRAVASSLRTTTVLVVPAAIGCAVYADIGIAIFSRESFGPAEDNLRALSLFVLLLYFSMTLGVALTAAGLQRKWAATQWACVAVSAALDPLLIPWFEHRTGNGSLGVCVSTVMSEALMVGFALWLLPRGLVDRALLRGVGLALAAGAAMIAVALSLSGFNRYLSAATASTAYFVCLWMIGGLDEEQTRALRGIFSRRKARLE